MHVDPVHRVSECSVGWCCREHCTNNRFESVWTACIYSTKQYLFTAAESNVPYGTSCRSRPLACEDPFPCSVSILFSRVYVYAWIRFIIQDIVVYVRDVQACRSLLPARHMCRMIHVCCGLTVNSNLCSQHAILSAALKTERRKITENKES